MRRQAPTRDGRPPVDSEEGFAPLPSLPPNAVARATPALERDAPNGQQVRLAADALSSLAHFFISRLKALVVLALAVALSLCCRASISMAAEEAQTEAGNIGSRLGAWGHGITRWAAALWQGIWATIKSVDPSVWVAIFTGFLVVVTAFRAGLAWRQRVGYRRTERAYVTLSHYSDRGVPALQVDLDERIALVTMRVKNFGNTPATIRHVSLALRVSGDRLPRRPRYGPADEDTGFFLVKGDHFDLAPSLVISEEDAGRIADGATVWLLGYVDYQDVLGRHFRGGYARRWDPDPAIGANNLMFETKRGYNYDRRRRWWR
jgi:hypothetical protein